MYVVVSGTVGLSKDSLEVAELGRGQHFGEMALIDRTVRSLTASAKDDARLLAIKRTDFYAIIKKEPTLSVKLLWSFVQVLGSRLRKTTADLTGALKGEVSGSPADLLFRD
jgi:CRP-like cAMP-binding protein